MFTTPYKSIRFSLFLLLFCLYSNLLFAQEVQILDEQTKLPVPLVAITQLGSGQGVLTDSAGRADIKKLPTTGYFSFRHPAYQEQILSYTALSTQNYIVLLKESFFEMSEVVVSANRWEQSSGSVPNQLVSISPAEIARQQPQTAAEMLMQSGQVFVQKSQQGGGSPMLRGFAANSLLLVLDGIRMNNAIYRSGNLHNLINIDPLVLEGSEVIFGPGSVLYGSDALGGVIDFHTRRPPLGSDSLYYKTNAMLRWSSANKERTAHADLTLGKGRWGYLGSFSISDFDDLRAGSQRPDEDPDFGKRFNYVERINGRDSIVQNSDVDYQRFSGYTLYSTLQKLRYQAHKDHFLQYTLYASSTSDMPRYDRLIERKDAQGTEGPLRSAEWYYGPQRWIQHNLQWLGLNNNLFYQQARITAGWQDYKESRHDRRLGANSRRNRIEQVDQLSLNADFERPLGKTTELFYGLEGIYDWVKSEAYSEDIRSGERSELSTRYPDEGSNYYSLSAYTYAQHALRTDLRLNGGLRYTLTGAEASFSRRFFPLPDTLVSLSNQAVNGSLSLIYQPSEHLKLSALGSTGFRAPNIDDLAKIFDSEPGNVVVPNPGLKPEYSYNSEFSVEWKPLDRLNLQGTLYKSWLRDAMVRREFTLGGQDSIFYDGQLSKVEALVNTGSAYVWGYSLGLAALLPGDLLFKGHYNFQLGRDQADDSPLRHAPPAFGQFSLSRKNDRWEAGLYWEFSQGFTFEELAPSEQSKAYLYSTEGSLAWSVFHIRAAYQLNNALMLRSGLENIFDRHYRTYSSGISAPGRNFYIALQASL